ncbi:MAG: ABC transporter permease [Opitutia bacterium]|nr:ABC transporter permease [Opitutaceae bacterium]PHX70275.1 MAG: ABC transporter permease [Opitutae bacterium]
MPWYLYLACKQLFPSGRFPFFTAISVLGVTLGVAVLIIVTSVMGGFGYEIRRMIVETEGEVDVKATGYLSDPQDVLAQISATPGVAAATPYVKGVVGVQANGRPAYPIFRGVDVGTIERVANLGRFTNPRSAIANLDDDSVVLSSQLATSLGVHVGDKIEIYSPLLIEKLKNDEVFLPREFRVVGELYIGHQQLDSSTIYGTLRAAQELYGLGRSVHGIYVRVKPDVDEHAVVAQLNTTLPRATTQAYSWMESWADFLWVLNLEKSINFFLLLFIVIIAAFSVMSSLLISVVRKTREIGLLGALGARPRDVALCFCAQAFIIGLTGTAIGVGMGFGVLAIRNDLVHGIARLLQRQETLRQFYQFSDLPSHTLTSDLVMTVVASIVISTLAGLIPAWRAARLRPVEALRSE